MRHAQYLSQSQTSVNEAISHERKCRQRNLVCHCLYTAVLQTKNDMRQQIMMCQLCFFFWYFFCGDKHLLFWNLSKAWPFLTNLTVFCSGCSGQKGSELWFYLKLNYHWRRVKKACSLSFCLDTVTKSDCYEHLLAQIKAQISVWVKKIFIQTFCQR